MLLLTIEIGVLYQVGTTSPIVMFQCLGITSLENEIAHEETRKTKQVINYTLDSAPHIEFRPQIVLG